MKKNASKKATKEVGEGAQAQRTLLLAEYVRDNLFAFVVREGMKALDVLLEQDREALCGPAYARARE
jgi:hypothetical protein